MAGGPGLIEAQVRFDARHFNKRFTALSFSIFRIFHEFQKLIQLPSARGCFGSLAPCLAIQCG